MSEPLHDDPPHQSPLTPEPILQALSGLMVSGIVKAGIESGTFAAVCHGQRSLAEIAVAIGSPERTTRILCDALTGLKFLRKEGDQYLPAPFVEAFLDPAKPSYFGTMVNIFASPMAWTGFSNLTSAVRKGGTLLADNALTPEHPFWEVFAQSTFTFSAPSANLLAAAVKRAGLPAGARIADLACGTGVYGLVTAASDPAAELTLVDWPNVLEHTCRYVAQMGLERRCLLVGGDLFKVDYGEDFDLVILANVHHHFDEATNIELNRRVHRSLKKGGLCAVVDFVPDDARAEATMPLMFGCLMMSWTPAGDVYSEAEYRRLFTEAGFSSLEKLEEPGVPQSVLLARA